jgi:hypothetical protein
MNNNIKLILNAAMIVWVIILYLNVGQFAPRTAAVSQEKSWLDRLPQPHPTTTGILGLGFTTT